MKYFRLTSLSAIDHFPGLFRQSDHLEMRREVGAGKQRPLQFHVINALVWTCTIQRRIDVRMWRDIREDFLEEEVHMVRYRQVLAWKKEGRCIERCFLSRVRTGMR